MKAFRLEGSSMKPLFREGGVALVSPLGSPSSFILRSGDCAVYRLEGRTLLHRVIKTGEKGAWFSDDAGRLAPHFVLWEDIEGKVISGNPLNTGRSGLAYSRLRRLLGRLGSSNA